MLEAYRVLDLTDERGMLCGQILADLGADVITIEPPEGSSARRLGPFAGDRPGPEQSLHWQAYARGKRSVVLDLEAEADRRKFRHLARGADAVIESFAPGYLDGLGLGYAALSACKPGLVLVSVTPFGQSGPKAGWAATDLTLMAASYLLLLTGDADRPPVRVSVPQAFLHAGADAAVATLIALEARRRDGLGQHVDVSAQAAASLGAQFVVHAAGWNAPEPSRNGGGIAIGPIRIPFVHACANGYVSITFSGGNAIGPFTDRLMQVLFEDGYIDQATRRKDWNAFVLKLRSGEEPLSELDRWVAAIGRWAAAHTKRELLELAMQRSLLIAPVNTTADLLASEQLANRHFWLPAECAALGRSITYPGPFARFSAAPIHYSRPAPCLNEHARELDNGRWQEGSGESVPDPAGAPQPAAMSPAPAAVTALAGLKVLDFSWAYAGPMGTRPLADYGATVVHVESSLRIDSARTVGPMKDAEPGAERSGCYSQAQAGKLGLTLNLVTPEAHRIALRLAAWADIVVENFAPGRMAKLGLDYERLRAVNPAVIMISTSLNGQSGPEAGLAGFGTMGAALAGFHQVTGWPDRPPAGPFNAYTDAIAPRYLTCAALAAIEHRRRTGKGQYIDLSQIEAAIHFLAPAVLDYTVNGRDMDRAGNYSPDHAPHGVYPARGQDRWVAIACGSEAEWQGLCAASGHPEWHSDPRFATFAARHEHRVALDAELAAWTMEREVEEIEERLQAAGVPVHRASSSADLYADPQLAHRGFFVTLEHPLLGPISIDNARYILSRTPAEVRWPGPTYGQHNDEVLRSILGLGDEEIAELATAGALE